MTDERRAAPPRRVPASWNFRTQTETTHSTSRPGSWIASSASSCQWLPVVQSSRDPTSNQQPAASSQQPAAINQQPELLLSPGLLLRHGVGPAPDEGWPQTVILVQPKCVLVRAKRGRRASTTCPDLFSTSPLWSGFTEERRRTAAGSRKTDLPV